jgi:uncharacterized protein YgiM (DUF1202 family)
MKKNVSITLLLILIILLTGCGALAAGEIEKEPRRPLDLSQWPTPAPEQPTPTPTPFPQTTLAPTPIPAADASTTGAAADLDFSGSPAELIEQITLATGGLPPVGLVSITANETTIYQQSQDSSQALDTLKQGDLAAALGKSEDGAWVYVITPAQVQGWLPADAVRFTFGSLASAPVLTPDQLAGHTNQDDNSVLLSLLGDRDPAELARLNALQEFKPVGVGLITTENLTLRQGPGDTYGIVDTLQAGEVTGILGKNSGGDWLYLVTLGLDLGWSPVNGLRAVGDLSKAPVLPANPVAAVAARVTGSTSATGSIQPLNIAELEAVGAAQVNNAALNLRQRPGSEYKLLDTLAQGDEVKILGLNRDGEWALVQTTAGRLGWGSMDYLAVAGSLTNAPRLRSLEPLENQPDNEIAPVILLNAANATVADSSPADNTAQATPATQPAAESQTGPTLAPVASGRVIEKVELRLGPGATFSPVQSLEVDAPLMIRGRNTTGDWLVVESINSKIGWSPVGALAIEDGSAAAANPVNTAWAQSNALEVKGGPAIYFETVGALGINDLVAVLGLNEGRNWALVETRAGGQGWLPLRFLNITAPLNAIPQITAPPATDGSPGEAAPLPAGPPTGQLVFQTSSGGDIMLINADGSGLRKITNGIDPVLSPDGQTIAFTRWQGETGSLWTIGADGSNERQVLGFIKQAKGPDWSPDGSQIILNFQYGGRLADKRDCNLNTGGRPPRNATNFTIGRNSKGQIVVCWTLPPDAHWSLRLVSLTDGSFKDLYGGVYAFRPAFDPAQPWRVVSDSGDGLLGIDINRNDFRQPLSNIVGDGSPVFSPDGRFIAVVTDVQGGHDIFRLNADGSGRVRLTQTPLWVPVQPDSNSQQWHNVAPAWSPDGSQIAFLTDRTGRWEIWLMNADGSNQHPMFPEDINNRLDITYNFVDERVLSWR